MRTIVLTCALAALASLGCDDSSDPKADARRADGGDASTDVAADAGADGGGDGAADAAADATTDTSADAPMTDATPATDGPADLPPATDLGADAADAGDGGQADVADVGPDQSATDATTPGVTTGSFPLYHTPANIAGAKPRNDASGIVFLPGAAQLLFIDDGGEDATPDVVPFYLAPVASLFGAAVLVTELPAAAGLAGSLPAKHRDMEALARGGDFIYVMSSLPAASEKADPGNRAFSRFKFEGGEITAASTIEPRDAIMAALSTPTADPWHAAWLARWKDRNAKDGGLQVEALSGTGEPTELLVALRSPHYSADYLTPNPTDATKTLSRVGPAMLVSIDVTDFAAGALEAAVHATLDLGGLGFRGMEHSPAADGYFITAGAVEAGFDYGFYFWNGDPAAKPVNLADKVPEFKKLCRPESVTELDHAGKKYLLVLSEQSGAICETPAAPYNYLLIELTPEFLGMLE